MVTIQLGLFAELRQADLQLDEYKLEIARTPEGWVRAALFQNDQIQGYELVKLPERETDIVSARAKIGGKTNVVYVKVHPPMKIAPYFLLKKDETTKRAEVVLPVKRIIILGEDRSAYTAWIQLAEGIGNRLEGVVYIQATGAPIMKPKQTESIESQYNPFED